MDGQILNKRYRLGRLLGRGGMSHVYLALDLDTQSDVAVKTLLPARAIDQQVINRFRSEAEILKKLRHNNIVEFYDYFIENNNHYIVMEYVSGGSLRDLLRRQHRLDSRRVCEIGLSLVSALTAAHDLGVVHRDIKPTNILIAEDGTVRLTDFGVARLKADSPLNRTRESTAWGSLPGTITYMSPESLSYGARPDERSDVWSLGVVFYEMLCGSPPFSGKDNTETASLIRETPLPSLQNRADNLWPALNLIVQGMLAKNPAERYQSMRRIAAELDEALRAEGVITPSMSMKDALKRAVSGKWGSVGRDNPDLTQPSLPPGAPLLEAEIGPYNTNYSASRALILAPGAYRDAKITPTQQALQGAWAFGQLLHEQYGFQVQAYQGTQVTRALVHRALEDLQKCDPDDRLIIYWAGAARTRTDRYGQETGFLAVHDTDWEEWNTFIEIDDLVDVRFLPAKHVFFILDALTQGPLDVSTTTGEDMLPEVALSHAGLHLLAAGARHFPPTGPITLFASVLMQGLRSQTAGEGVLSADMLGAYVLQQVITLSHGEQQPVYARLQGGERGCFLFRVPLTAYLPREVMLGVRSVYPSMRHGMVQVLRDFALQSRNEVRRAAMDLLGRLARNDPTQSVKDAARLVLAELLDSTDSNASESSSTNEEGFHL